MVAVNNTSEVESMTFTKKKVILTISAAYSLHGHHIQSTLDKEWSTKTSPFVRSHFTNIGFDFLLDSPEQSLLDLRRILNNKPWDGVIVGWCIRGMSIERTEVFEGVMAEVMEAGRKQKDLKAIFCRGPNDLVEATLRNFPVDEMEEVV